MKKKKKDNLTLDYESDFTYAQKLNRGKRSRAGISAQNLAARLLAIILYGYVFAFSYRSACGAYNIQPESSCGDRGDGHSDICDCLFYPRRRKTGKARPHA